MGNDELLSDASKREMQQPYWKVEQADEHYGLGFDVIDVGERRLIGHGGGFPGHTTRTIFDPKNRLVVVVLINEISGPALPLAKVVVRILDYALAQPRAPRDESPSPHDRFAGRFAALGSATDIA